MWLLLYGCAVISASTVTHAQHLRLIATMGGVFIALGSVTFWLPPSVHTLALGAGFGACTFCSEFSLDGHAMASKPTGDETRRERRGPHTFENSRRNPWPCPAPAQTSDDAKFDRLVYERVRLGIMSALAVNERLTFNELKSLFDVSDGNLSAHARKLEEAGYLECTKSFEGRRPKSEYQHHADRA